MWTMAPTTIRMKLNYSPLNKMDHSRLGKMGVAGLDKEDEAVDSVNPALAPMADEDNCDYTGKQLRRICRKVSQGF